MQRGQWRGNKEDLLVLAAVKLKNSNDDGIVMEG
jgi:hypothetical protein